MICQKCGAENKDGALFCENCGTSLSNHSETKLIKLHCKNCGGEMSINPDQQEIICPYCGQKQVLLDSDAVRIEKEKYKTIKEMQKNQYQAEKEKQEFNDKRDELAEYKKSKQSKFTLAAAVISFMVGMGSLTSHEFFKGILFILLFALFLYSYLCGMQIVKEKIKNTKTLGVLAACLLLVVFSFSGCLSSKDSSSSSSEKDSSSTKTYEKLEWPSSGLASMLPKPSFKYGAIDSYGDDYFWVTFNKATEKEYNDYVEECKKHGFTYDSSGHDTSYYAYTNEGYSLSLYYDETDAEISLHLSSPEEYAEFSWPSSSLASLIPESTSHVGYVFENTEEEVSIEVAETTLEEMGEYINKCIEMGFNVDYYKTDDYFQANDVNGNSLMITKGGFKEMYIEITKAEEKTIETPVPTAESTSTDNSNNDSAVSDVVTPSFKEMMDGYESFMDDYIAFMEKYESADDTSSMLLDYTNLVAKELEWLNKIDSVDESQLSVADDLYYLEVTARVNKKLYDASLN